jgi:hypothetical protein
MKNMNSSLLIIILFSATLIWLTVLTYFYYKAITNYNKLSKERGQDLNKDQIADINNSVLKIGFVRFNPFNETGGDNSFTLCFLNGRGDGIVLTGLHTREKTRMYAKKIDNGRSIHELSVEERKAIAEALNK